MNNDRRERISKVWTTLDEMRAEIETLQNEEQEAFDNMPESLQQSERGERASNAADALQEAFDGIDSVCSALDTARE